MEESKKRFRDSTDTEPDQKRHKNEKRIVVWTDGKVSGLVTNDTCRMF